MTKMIAMAVFEDGTEPLGTMFEVAGKTYPRYLTGEYKELQNFIKWQVLRFGRGWKHWNIHFGRMDHPAQYRLTLIGEGERDYSGDGYRLRISD